MFVRGACSGSPRERGSLWRDLAKVKIPAPTAAGTRRLAMRCLAFGVSAFRRFPQTYSRPVWSGQAG